MVVKDKESPKEVVARGLEIAPAAVCRDIQDLILSTTKNLNRDGAVVALSGGLDSAVAATLTVRSLGADKVHLVNLPERDSKSIHRRHAQRLAQHLGVRLTVRRISPILRAAGVYRLTPLGLIPGQRLRGWLVQFGRRKLIPQTANLLTQRFQLKANSWAAKGVTYAITKHRVRMVCVYQHAQIHNLLVVGAANRTEWLTGTFVQWGVDHCADVMPLIHLYRSQLEQLAEYLQVPEFIQGKAADPDVLPGIDDKGALLGDFGTVDAVLYGLEAGMDPKELARAFGQETVERMLTLRELSAHMRASPYQIE